jgi:hypothetical protein
MAGARRFSIVVMTVPLFRQFKLGSDEYVTAKLTLAFGLNLIQWHAVLLCVPEKKKATNPRKQLKQVKLEGRGYSSMSPKAKGFTPLLVIEVQPKQAIMLLRY